MIYTFKPNWELGWAILVAVMTALVQVMPVEMPTDVRAWAGVAVAAITRAVFGAILALKG